MSNIKKSFLMGGAAAGAALIASAFFSILAVSAACTNPATIPTGFTAPCPVFSLSAATVTQAQTLTLSATPQVGTDYIYTQAYISQGTAWNLYTLSGNNAYPAYSSALASLTLSSTQLQALSLGTHYAVVWDWLWDATANCYKGPGLDQCNTGQWRVQSFTITSSYAYSQSSYYAYSQAAYTGGSTVRVNSGGSAYTDTAGNAWSADSGFTGGTTFANTNSIANTADPTLYHTERYGTFQYALPVVNGSYSVTLKFAETILTGAGQRVFNVTLNGATILSNFDIYAAAGGMNIAIDKTFPVNVTGGQISLNFIANVQNPKVNAIQIVPAGTYTYSQSAYYAYSQSSYYVYSQSSYYAYSQSAYYAYSQAAYTGGNAIPATFFGHHDMTTWPGNPFGFIRTWDHWGGGNIQWPYLEPSRGSYNWTALDNFVNQATGQSKQILFTMGITPAWATAGACSNSAGCTQPPANIADWDNFVTAIITRYHASIKHWECWNEANNTSQFWTGTFSQLANLCQDLNTIAKGIDSGLTILTPSATGGANAVSSFFSSYFSAGGGAYADAIAFHGYPAQCCTSGSNPAPEEINSIVSGLKSQMSAHGQAGKLIWDTEGGWGENITTPNQSNQAAFLARHYLLQWSDGVSHFAWYAWDNSAWGCLTCNSAAQVAYTQTYNWMVGSTMNQACAANGTVWTCGLKNSASTQTQPVWNTAGSSTYTVPSGYAHYKDLAGNTNAISGSTVTIGIQPILLVP